MKPGLQEIFALASTLGVLAGVPVGINSYQKSRAPDATRVIELTGVMKDGAWTDEKVTAASFWSKTYQPATVVVHVGEEVLLRLASADVTHGFYVPELGVGPVEVEPGHVVEVRMKADRAGEFTYYCTAVCGKCHHFMRGLVRVLPVSGSAVQVASDQDQSGVNQRTCPHHAAPPGVYGGSLVERGRQIFETRGCTSCHGERGAGGVRNPNYVKDTVPALNRLAERMMLFDKEEAETVIRQLEANLDLKERENNPPFPTYGRFLAQYDAVKGLVRMGNVAGKKDPSGPEPPLHMPAWKDNLSNRDIDAVIAYLLAQFPWEAEE